jgi:hypothetical protein
MSDDFTHENYNRTIEELLTEIYFTAFNAPKHMQRAWAIISDGLEGELDEESQQRALEYAMVRYSEHASQQM